MKKIIVMLLISQLCSVRANFTEIISYETKHKDALMAIAFEDANKFFCGSDIITRGFATQEEFYVEGQKGMDESFDNPLKIKKVLMIDDIIAGFILFFVTKEQSIESLRKISIEKGFVFDEKALLAAMPYLKKSDAECELFIKLEGIAISREFRGKGFGRELIHYLVKEVTKNWPHINKIYLDVNDSNDVARKLYESEGFIVSPQQPPLFPFMGVIQYEKTF